MLTALLAATFASAVGDSLPKLAPSFKVLDDGTPIAVDVGHAAPYLYDIDRDGKKDLLVGQFGEGKLRFYRNLGTNGEPVFKGFTYVQAGGKDAAMRPG